jgi:L-asparaginase
MPSLPPEASPHVLVIATGGTIAGTAAQAGDNVGYRAAQLGVDSLLAAVPALAGQPLRTLQLAQLDSKDAGPLLWQPLVASVQAALAQPEVCGIVVTHGTDTLEETAALLQRVLAPAKPVVLTAAMRPATSLQADGPQNLLDAVLLARTPGAHGVLVVLAGQAHAADEVRKRDSYRLDAFDSAPAGPLALLEEGRVVPLRPWPATGGRGGFVGAVQRVPDDAVGLDADTSLLAALQRPAHQWPRVAWITSHAGFDGALVDAAVAAGFQGLVLAGTGNGSLHAELQAAAARAQQAGVVLRLCTRCANGRLVGPLRPGLLPGRGSGPAQARVHLMLDLLREPMQA